MVDVGQKSYLSDEPKSTHTTKIRGECVKRLGPKIKTDNIKYEKK